MLSFFRRHWRGEAPFWLSAIGASVLLPLAVYVTVTVWLKQWSMQHMPVSRMIEGAIGFSLIAAVAIWQLTGTWRASAKQRAPARWLLTRWAARAVALVIALGGLLMLSALPAGMKDLYEQATDQDWIGQKGFDVSVQDENLFVNGYMSWGLLDKVSKLLASNPQIRAIVLNSPGGHVGVGTRLYDMIHARGLDTYAVEMCGSACTLAFIGGAQRYLRKGSKLGFHAVGGDGSNAIDAGTAKVVAIYKAADIPDDFLQHVLTTPPESVWYPDSKQLMDANIITEVVR